MEHRSIDVAKTASVNLMDLNNKVVNMRQVVKRAKAQTVNKLSRRISDLKKKQGSEKEKAQNLRKAERCLEEIESVKRLKDDKVSKYSLANSMSLDTASKVTHSAGVRALARLASHHLIKKAVKEFQENHSDWKDLVAYLLVKQTGRKFKTKKQKQQKINKRVENIHASEEMTKTYIQDRFGESGLKKAEEKFLLKRKKKKNVSQEMENEENEIPPQKASDQTEEKLMTVKKTSEKQVSEAEHEKGLKKKDERSEQEDTEHSQHISPQPSEEDCSSDGEDSSDMSDKKTIKSTAEVEEEDDDDEDDDNDEEEEDNNSHHSCDELSDSYRNVKTLPKYSLTQTQVAEKACSQGLARECVVQKLKIGNVSEDSDSDDNENEVSETQSSDQESDIADDSDSKEGKEYQDDSCSDGDDSSSGAEQFEKPHSKLKLSSNKNRCAEETLLKSKHSSKRKQKAERKQRGMEFLTKTDNEALKLTKKDSFFEGYESEDDHSSTRQSENEDESFKDFDDKDYSQSKNGYRKTKSLFYDPTEKEDKHKGRLWENNTKRRNMQGQGRFRENNRTRGERSGRPREHHENFRKGIHGNKGWKSRQDGANRGFNRRNDSKLQSLNTGPHSSQKQMYRRDELLKKSTFGSSEIKEKGTAKPVKSEAGEKLHPSWEASRKRKAQESQAVPFQGKRITFGD